MHHNLDISLSIGIIGFGNQAKAWAMNLRDSGYDVHIYLRRKSSSILQTEKLGFKSFYLDQLNKSELTNFVILTPDHTHNDILVRYFSTIGTSINLIYAHGYSLLNDKINLKFPQFNHLLLAPKSIASELRYQYETGKGVAGVFSVEHSKKPNVDENFLKQLAKDIGIFIGPYKTSFENETKADLFSEQSILCSVLPYLSNYCFNFLVEKGIEKEVALFECWYELKLIVDTLLNIGPEKFFQLISPNALLGSQKALELFKNDQVKEIFRKIWEDIDQGHFNRDIQNLDIENIRKEVLHFWKNQKLNQLHHEILTPNTVDY